MYKWTRYGALRPGCLQNKHCHHLVNAGRRLRTESKLHKLPYFPGGKEQNKLKETTPSFPSSPCLAEGRRAMAPGAALSLLSTWAEQIAQQPWEKWLLPSCWSQGLSWVPWHMAAQLRAGHSHRVKKCDLCCSCHYCLHGIIITESTCSKVVAFTVT